MRGKHLWLMLCIALLMSATLPGGRYTPGLALADERDVADVSVFDEPLAQHGTWTTVPEHGRVWRPHGVPKGWRPYTDGRWVYSDAGWTWVSDHPWGWAPFHYGRWSVDTAQNWYWVPGTTWGPAWVSWRHNPGWVGWAPLPPQVRFQANIGLDVGHTSVDIAPQWFSFVPDRHMLAPRVRMYIQAPTHNVRLLRLTRNVTNYTVINNRIVNRSIDVRHIERVTRRPVVVHRLVDDDDERGRGPRVRDKDHEVVIGRPAATRDRRDADDAERRERPGQGQTGERREQPRQKQTGERRERPGQEQVDERRERPGQKQTGERREPRKEQDESKPAPSPEQKEGKAGDKGRALPNPTARERREALQQAREKASPKDPQGRERKQQTEQEKDQNPQGKPPSSPGQ